MFVLSRYVAEGERVFRVEPGLARLLLDTDLPKITGEEFHLPFSALYLEFPGKLFVVPEEEWVLIGCYVLDHRPYDNIVSVDFVLEPQKGEVHGLGEFLIQVNIDVTPGRQINWNDLMSGFEKSLFAINPFKSAAEYAAKMAGFASEVVELVVNSVLYSTSSNPELTEVVRQWRTPKAQRKKSKSGRQKTPLPVPRTRQYKLGESIPIEYGAPRAQDRSQQAKTDRKLLKRVRVRGHWHWYLHGKGKSLRKHLWVKPYRKGPKDVAELLKRKYQLK